MPVEPGVATKVPVLVKVELASCSRRSREAASMVMVPLLVTVAPESMSGRRF